MSSIIKFLHHSENRTDDVNLGIEAAKKVVGFGGILYAGSVFAAQRGLDLSNPLDRVKDMQAFARGEKSKVQQMGISLQKEVTSVLENVDRERARIHEAELEKINSATEIESILEGRKQERNALIQSIIDNLEGGNPDELEAARNKLYTLINASDDEVKSNMTLINEHLETIRSNPESADSLVKSYSKHRPVGHLLSSARETFGMETIGQKRFYKGYQEYLAQHGLNPSRKVENFLERLGPKGLGGDIKGIVSIDEFAGQGNIRMAQQTSLYATVGFGNKTVLAPLQLVENNGLRFLRTTLDFSTRYSVPTVLSGHRLQNQLNIAPGDVNAFKGMQDTGDIVGDHIRFLERVKTSIGGMENLTNRQINYLGERLRTMGEVVSGSYAKHSASGRSVLDSRLLANLGYSYRVQANKAIIMGINDLPSKNQRTLVPTLSSSMSEVFDAPNSSATVRRTMNTPFSGINESFTQINLRGEDRYAPIDVFETYGMQNRLAIPVTARETQMLGRPEIFVGLNKMDSTATRYYANQGAVDLSEGHLGQSGRSVIPQESKGLFSVRDIPESKGLAGMNMSGFLFTRNDFALKAGLGEGMVYAGAAPKLRRLIPKTINLDEGRGLFVEELRRRGGSMQMSATELFRRFGEGNTIFLGNMDGQRIELPHLKFADSYTIETVEEIDASKKRKLNINFQLDELAVGNKIFSILGKAKLNTSYINSPKQLKKLIMQATGMVEGEANELVEMYTKQFGANLQSSIIGTIDTATKAPGYMAQLLAGGAEHFGVKLPTESLAIGAGTGVEQQRQYVNQFLNKSLNAMKQGNINPQQMGVLLGGFSEVASSPKYDYLSETEFERVIRNNMNSAEADTVLRYSRLGITFGGAALFAGTSESVLRENLASFEPRVANYLSENLRTIHGLKETEVVEYVTDLLARKENLGEQSKLVSVFGTMTETMTPLSDKSITKRKIENLVESGEAIRLGKSEAGQLAAAFQSGEEETVRKALANIGGEGTRATVFSIEDFVKGLLPGSESEKVAEFLRKDFKSKELLLPAGETMGQLGAFQIRTKDAGGKISIEDQFTRSLVDFVNVISSGGRDPDKLGGSVYRSVLESLTGPAGIMTRNIFAGKIAGSGSFNPKGLIMGKTLLSNDEATNLKAHKITQSAFEGTKGKAIFGDVTAFANLMDDFGKAVSLTPSLKGMEQAEIKKMERKMVEDFLFTPFRLLETKTAQEARAVMKDYSVSVLGKRDPVLGPSHLMPNLNFMNIDIGTKFDLITGDKGIRSGYYERLADVFNRAQEAVKNGEVSDESQKLLSRVFGSGFETTQALEGKSQKSTAFDRLKKQKVNLEDLYKMSKMSPIKDEMDKFLVPFFREVMSEGVGSGDIKIPEFHATLELVGKDKKVTAVSSRMDYFKFAIGDFDGDIVSLFLDFKKNTSNISQNISMINQYKYGAKFVALNELINGSMADLGKRLKAGELSAEQFKFHEASKEEILKNVGGLDTQIKTGILGASLDFKNLSADERGSLISFMTTAQEVLNIKAKKLPVASPIADYFAKSLAEGFKKGNTEQLEYLMRSIFKESPLSQGVEISGLKFDTAHGGMSVFDDIAQVAKGQKVSLDDIIAGAKVMVRSVRKHNLEMLKSDNAASRLMASRNISNASLLRSLLQDSDVLETAFLRPREGEIDDIFRTIHKNLDVSPSRITQGKAGAAVAAVLGGSYLVSSFSTPGSFVPENAFSDYRVKNRMQIQNVAQAVQRGDSNISPASVLPQPHKEIIGRQINTGQYYSHEASSVSVNGKAPTLEQAYGVSSLVGRSGGRGIVSINDKRLPITGNYIDRMMGE